MVASNNKKNKKSKKNKARKHQGAQQTVVQAAEPLLTETKQFAPLEDVQCLERSETEDENEVEPLVNVDRARVDSSSKPEKNSSRTKLQGKCSNLLCTATIAAP